MGIQLLQKPSEQARPGQITENLAVLAEGTPRDCGSVGDARFLQ